MAAFVRVLLALLALTSVANAADQDRRELSEADIQSRLVGHALRWWAEDTWYYGEVLFAPDGSAMVTMENPTGSDEGRWRLAQGEICTKWQSARGGSEKCYRVVQVAERRFVTSGGNVFEIIEPGA